jgi:hypothetical protein
MRISPIARKFYSRFGLDGDYLEYECDVGCSRRCCILSRAGKLAR